MDFHWSDLSHSAVVVVIFILGLVVHYVKTEENQKHRYNELAKWLEQHERRICDLEGRNYQPTGLSTYIPRLECEAKHEELKKEFRDLAREIRNSRGGGV